MSEPERKPEFERSGQVGGDGHPVPIVAHAGEYVVNAQQMAELRRGDR